MEIRIMESKTLGDYIIIKQIGQGSFGIVYLAEHRYMKRHYALKILPEELATDRAFIQRFEDEVSQLSTLEHPNIVKIHNISFFQGQYFLVMDCVVDDMLETTNLAKYLIGDQKKLSEERIYQILLQVALGLDYAHHKRSIVHGNLKLNNILIGKTKNGNLEVSISDFGLTKVIGPSAVLTRIYKNVAENLGLTSVLGLSKNSVEKYPNPAIDNQKLNPLHTSFLQSFAFLAPEQKRLDNQKSVDKKSDVYAFGVLTYFLLMNEFAEGNFQMPSMKFPEYQKGWDSLIKNCLHSDPAKRPEMILPSLEAVMQTTKGLFQPAPQFLDVAIKEKIKEEIVIAEKIPEIKPIEIATCEIHEAVQEIQFKSVQKSEIADVMESVNEIACQLSSTQEASSAHVLKPVFHTAELKRPEVDPDPAAIFQIDTTVKHYMPEQKEVKNIQPLRTEMIVIPEGNFLRGSNGGNRDETPRHQVHLSSFAIDIHPVTNEQFVRFLDILGGEKDSNHQDVIRLRDSRIKRSGGKLSIESGYAKHPVVGVTWYGAMAYAKWVGMRLPTEAEWEIAAYGGLEGVLYPTGDDIEKTESNFFSSDTTPVKSYPANDYGLYDMSGNVYEWCYDWYGYNYYEVSIQEPENPMGPLQGVYRVLRGGCWKSLKEDLRCSRRHKNNPGTVNGTYGFRCVTDAQ